MNGRPMIESPFLTYWRALGRAWAVLGLPEPSLADAVASWEAGKAAWREGQGLYGKVTADG
jgi:hypothetical protein